MVGRPGGVNAVARRALSDNIVSNSAHRPSVQSGEEPCDVLKLRPGGARCVHFTPPPCFEGMRMPGWTVHPLFIELEANYGDSGGNMIRRLLNAPLIFLATTLVVPLVGDAQTFKVEKFDIKGEGGTDYVAVEAATGRVFVSRATHMMVVDGATGKVLGDIPNTPGVHGAGIATKAGHGFTTNGGDQTVTMFDLKTLALLRQIKVGPGLDGIMYDEPDDKIILTNHSRPIGTLTALNPKTGDIVATVELEDTAPEGAAADGKGHIFVNNESKNTIQVIDVKTWKATASWRSEERRVGKERRSRRPPDPSKK